MYGEGGQEINKKTRHCFFGQKRKQGRNCLRNLNPYVSGQYVYL